LSFGNHDLEGYATLNKTQTSQEHLPDAGARPEPQGLATDGSAARAVLERHYEILRIS